MHSSDFHPVQINIVAAKRTPLGALQGSLSSFSAAQLVSFSHRSCLSQSGLNPSDIDEVITGCVLQAAQGQGPARQGAILAGLPYSVSTSTVNKMCGSGMIALMIGCDRIKAGSSSIVLAGGMESMSQAPYLLSKGRGGYRLGHGELKDHIFLDGLEDAFDKGKLMGCFADETAEAFGFNRQLQDEFAARSMCQALEAQRLGHFSDEITAVTIRDRVKGDISISVDESPDSTKPAKLPRLKPVFSDTGTVTPGNSSSIADGAASLIITSSLECERKGLNPLARVVAYCSFGQEPQLFTTAPIGAIRKVIAKAGWSIDEVDLFEINEAFAVVTLCTIRELGLNPSKVNVNGGSCALGHPIGASGARIIVTLIYALKQRKLKKGIAAICIGGGEATAVAIELL